VEGSTGKGRYVYGGARSSRVQPTIGLVQFYVLATDGLVPLTYPAK